MSQNNTSGGALTAALPPETDMKIPALTLPTPWQTVLFYNYGYVSTERLAKVLECDTATVEREAERDVPARERKMIPLYASPAAAGFAAPETAAAISADSSPVEASTPGMRAETGR